MSDLIKRQDAIDALYDYWSGCFVVRSGEYIADKCEDEIIKLPSAEPEIIRCKDCAGYTGIDHAWGVCLVHKDCVGTRVCKAEDYCSWAERREDERNDI